MPTTVASSTHFSPSEMVVLFGERFAGAQGELATAVLSVALLAMERAGEIRLVHERRRALLGLMTREVVVAEATGSRAAWPAGSLEGELRETINGSRCAIEDVVLRFVGADTAVPERFLLDRVKRGLVARGLVQRGEGSIPDATRALLRDESPAALLELLDDTGERAALCELLRRQIAGALARREPNRP